MIRNKWHYCINVGSKCSPEVQNVPQSETASLRILETLLPTQTKLRNKKEDVPKRICAKKFGEFKMLWLKNIGNTSLHLPYWHSFLQRGYRLQLIHTRRYRLHFSTPLQILGLCETIKLGLPPYALWPENTPFGTNNPKCHHSFFATTCGSLNRQ